MYYFINIYQLFKRYISIYTLTKLVVGDETLMSKKAKLENQIF